MATPQRTRLALDERRAQLLERGQDLFSTRSYDEISIDDIAAAAGVSKGLLYHYFTTKRDFYVAVLREAADEMRSLTEPDPEQPPLERLRQSLDAYLDHVERNAVGYRTLLRGGIGSDAEVRGIVEETRAQMVARFLEGLDLDDPSPSVRLVLRGWIAMVEEISLAWLDTREPPRDELVVMLITILGSGLAAAGQLGEEVRAWIGRGLLEQVRDGAA